MFQQARAVVTVLGRKADADAAGHIHGAARQPDIAAQLAEYLLHQGIDVTLIGQAAQHEDELVAAQTRYDISLPDGRLQTPPDLDQELVADIVAERVVHVLEAVEIDQHDRHRFAARDRVLEHLLEPGAQAEAILEARQCIVIREEGNALLRSLAHADVFHHRPDMTLAVDGVHDDARDLHRNPRAVLALEAHLDRAEAAILQQRLDSYRLFRSAIHDFPIRPAERQNLLLRIAGDHLHGAIGLAKSSVHVVQRDAQRRQVIQATQLRLAQLQRFLSALA